MTLLWLDNFGYAGTDTGTTMIADNLRGSVYDQADEGPPDLYFPSERTSTAGYIRWGYNSGFGIKLGEFSTSYTSIVFGAAFRLDSPFNCNNFPIFHGQNSSYTHARLALTGGAIYLYDSTGSIVGSFGGVPTGVWFYMEVKITIDDSAGACEIRINGDQKLNVSSQDFRNNSTTTTLNYIWFRSGSSGYYGRVSEIYLDTDTFHGPIRIHACYPDEDSTTHTDFTPSTGSDHYAMVDETDKDDDTTYNSGGGLGNKDSYKFDTSPVVGPVKAVQLFSRSKRTGGSALKFKNFTRVSSTDYDGSKEHYPDLSYVPYEQVWELNPNTSSAWTTGELSNAEFGVHITGISTTTTT